MDAIDPGRVRRLFSRPALATADDFLVREVSRRLFERVATMRIEARRVLDVGCGSGADMAPLASRFPGAAVTGVDAAFPRVERLRRAGAAGRWKRWLGRDSGATAVQADLAALPFPARHFDVLWSNLALHWRSEPHRVLPEWSRVTQVGGLLAFSAFGPDTLREVADAFADVDDVRHVLPFTDMHDYGDMLVEAGFATPVVDMERLTLTYSSAAHLWAEVRALGGNAVPERVRGLRGRDYGRRVDEALARRRGDDGRYRLTFELLFAHAWKGEPRTTRSGESVVRVERRR